MTFDPALHELAVQRDRERARLNRRVVATIVMLLMAVVSYVFLTVYGVKGSERLLLSVVGGGVGALVLLGGVKISGLVSGSVMRGLLEPGGRGRAAAVFSQAEALAARGDFESASAAFDAVRAEHGDSSALIRAEAAMHLRTGGDPIRARELLWRLRHATDASRVDELFATHRLLDLYLGVLADPGRAMVELRRMADRFPDTPDGQGALAELRRRRDHFEQDQSHP